MNNCECGHFRLRKDAKVVKRFICHCEFCKNHVDGDFNDECFLRVSDLEFIDEKEISFNRSPSLRKPLGRGKCINCNNPVVSFAKLPIGGFILVPTELLPKNLELPDVCSHVFYHRRITEFRDSVPKYSNYWSSQIITLWNLFRGLRQTKL